MRLLNKENIEDIAIGAAILGTGGGGDPYIGKLMAIDAIEEEGPVRLVDPSEVPDEALVVPTAMMGAPTVMIEKIPRGDEVLEALRMLEKKFDRKAMATISAEAGGLNSTIPLAVGARLHIPVVDGDGMGRAFPEIQMVTFHLHGIKASPMTMSDEKGNSVLLEAIDNPWVERLSRALTVAMGGSAMIALYAMTGAQVKEAAVHGTISLAERLGRSIREARERKEDPIKKIMGMLNGFELFKGKVVDVKRRTVAGFARGEARFEGIDEYKGEELLIHFQNENLVAIRNGQIVASVPDLITVLETETALPITTEGMRYGYRATVLGIPCNDKWRTKKGLEVVGPRYFGYDIDYIPVEERMGKGKGIGRERE
ncbi:MAG: DUF917 domain-containing protein [Candidatus Methanomethyliaceae archaeon]